METAASCTVCQVYLNNLSRSAQIDSLEWLVSILKNPGMKRTQPGLMLNPHLSWGNDQLYIPHTTHYHADLCSDHYSWVAAPQFHSIF